MINRTMCVRIRMRNTRKKRRSKMSRRSTMKRSMKRMSRRSIRK